MWKRTPRLLEGSTIREALFYERLRNGRVKCNLCERRCVIRLGEKGFCGTRMNVEGRLYTLVYGDLSAIESRPIEIKPFFHYWPGSTALTFSTWSCNFRCPWCQNYHLSRASPEPSKARFHSPEKIVESAVRLGDEGLCASFQEPTLLTEWSLKVFRLGREKGLYSCYVSNGYMTLEVLRMLKKAGMDGLKIDVKGDAETYRKYCGGVDVEKVWRNIREAKRMGFHVEVVNLIVTGVNDSVHHVEGVVERHLQEAGPDTPIHFTRYYPAYKFTNPPTKIETLEKAYEIAKKAGIQYPYIGNVSGHPYENTYCPNCGVVLIRRLGYRILEYHVTEDSRCFRCHEEIPIRGRYIRKRAFYI